MKKIKLKYSATQKTICLFALLMLSSTSNTLQADETPNGFQFELTPYLWAATIQGTTSIDGGESPPYDSDYSFFALDNLDGVASATFTAQKEQWGFLVDFLYVGYEDTFKEGTSLALTARLEGTIMEFAGTYAPASFENFNFIAGLRNQDITVSMSLTNHEAEKSVAWTDPFLGVIYTRPLSGKFHMALRGDVGGFGIESDMAVNAEVMFRYQMNKTASIKFGYRYLKVEFDDNDLVYDISLDGVLVGLGIRF